VKVKIDTARPYPVFNNHQKIPLKIISLERTSFRPLIFP
jgi:hypothetical protein